MDYRKLGAAGLRISAIQEVIVATKVGNRTGPGPNDAGASKQHIFNSCEASLRRLQTDFIDLYQIHTPDRDTPIEETLDALNALVQQGKVRYIGCSNYFEWEVVEANWVARTRGLHGFVSYQDFYNLLYRDLEKRMLPMCIKYGLALLTRPMVPTVIAGADRPEHILDNAAALELTLSADDLTEIDRITLVDEDRTVAAVIRRPA